MTALEGRRRGRPARLSRESAGNSTVLKGIEILRLVLRSDKPVSVSALAAEMKISPSTAHRYVSSLCQAGFLNQDPDTGRYDIGVGAIELGITAMARVDGIRLAGKVMERLTAKTDLVSYLYVWGTNGPTVIKSEFGSVRSAIRQREGSNISLLTASGQIFLAHLPRETTEALYRRDLARWNDSVDPERRLREEDVKKMCETVRTRGFSTSIGLRNPGLMAFAAPVFGVDGKLMMGMTLIGVAELVQRSQIDAIIEDLTGAARQLSISLGAPQA